MRDHHENFSEGERTALDQYIAFGGLSFRDCCSQYYFLQEECEDDTLSVSLVAQVLASLTWSLEDVLINGPNSPAPQSHERAHVPSNSKRCADERLQDTCLLSLRQFPVDGTRQPQIYVGIHSWFLRLSVPVKGPGCSKRGRGNSKILVLY